MKRSEMTDVELRLAREVKIELVTQIHDEIVRTRRPLVMTKNTILVVIGLVYLAAVSAVGVGVWALIR